jgi:hypothetical protein
VKAPLFLQTTFLPARNKLAGGVPAAAGAATPPAVFTLPVAFTGLLLLALILQFLSGTYSAELGGYPDEAAHFTTSLMVHDYLTGGFPGSPLSFAKHFYVHYPKVGLGHWPPVFYILEALWMLIFSASKSSALAFSAVQTALCAALLGKWISRRSGATAGWLIAVLLIAVPLIQQHTAMTMVDMMLTLFSMVAAFQFAEFLESGSTRCSTGFWIFAAVAILTKGNAWDLMFVPPVAVLLTGGLRLILMRRFWIPGIFAMIFPAAWQLWTLRMAVQGWTGTAGPAFALHGLAGMASRAWLDFNPVVVLLAIIGIAAALARRPLDPGYASMLSLLVAVLLFHCLIPAGVETRYLIPALPPLLCFVPPGVTATGRLFRSLGFIWLSRPAVPTVLVSICFISITFAVPAKNAWGFEQAATWLGSQPDLQDSVTLLTSASDGEGIAISEIELHEKRPGRYVLRANKLLARSDWTSANYQILFNSPEAIRKELDRIPIGVLIVDFRPAKLTPIHHSYVFQMLGSREHSGDWRLAGSFHATDGDASPVRVYVRSGQLRKHGRIRVDLSRTLNQTLEE